jgi:ABC-type multidrug transport system fused ATPase/permease subunit
MADPIQQLRDLVTAHRWNAAVESLRRSTSREAAEIILALPFERQQALFRHLPKSLAATMVARMPYFHAYVLLHSIPTPEMAATIDAMDPGDRDQFLDELPEETWQALLKTLEEVHLSAAVTAETMPAEAGAAAAAAAAAAAPAPAAVESQPIIEARQLEKDYRQPEGRVIQVVAPIDLSIEPNTILALLGPSGCGKVHDLKDAVGPSGPIEG